MSADKRSVSTDALETLGTIIGPEAGRDAIHLAVLPAVAGERLHRAEYIDIVDGKAFTNALGHGIVDPFLPNPVEEGEYFWMVLKPRIITSLRHVWTYPGFPDVSDGPNIAEVMKKLDAMAVDLDVDGGAQAMLEHGAAYLDHSDYLTEGGRYEGSDLPTEYWELFEQATGRKVDENKRGSFFSCSC